MISITPFDPLTLILVSVLNPAVIIVAVMLGQRADEWQKLPIAAFAASIAGVVLFWFAAQFGLFAIHAMGGEAAIFVIQCLVGFLWAWLAFRYWHQKA